MIHVVLLSGGSGVRLWPLSNSARSKQFLKVLRGANGKPQSMLQRVYGQINNVSGAIDITIASSVSQESSIRAQLRGRYSLVLEPERRNTAAAIMLACAHLAFEQGASGGDTVVAMPVDSYAGQSFFNEIPHLGSVVAATNGLAMMGALPVYPSSKYGYIIPDNSSVTADARRVVSFVEKPTEEEAEALIGQGALWDCGVFAFKLQYMLGVLSRYCKCRSYPFVRDNYGQLPCGSFDCEIAEHADNAFVLSYSDVWRDLGTWNTLTEVMPDNVEGRAVVDRSLGVHVVNETELPLVVAGLSDAVVVATHDGILACGKEASADIKELIAAVGETRPMYEKRHWGEYRVVDSRQYSNGSGALTKELVISAGEQISYQRHKCRTEVWTVVAGTGEAVIDEKKIALDQGEVLRIRPLQMHAVRAFEELHIIEVQVGNPLIEEDIERFGNYW